MAFILAKSSKTISLLFLMVFGLFISLWAQTPTKLIVRAKAKDAKFIGSSMGGAMILVRNAHTGELLAKGITKGSTGDTQLLVKEPHTRYGKLSTEGSAQFETTLQLEYPVFVTIEATAPGVQLQTHVVSSTQLWLIPGKDITGDGVTLEIPGFAVDVLSPRAHEFREEGDIPIEANVVMMCGCPTSDGGLWDSAQFETQALVYKEGELLGKVPLSYSGDTSLFKGVWTPQSPGTYEIMVYAYDPRTGNTGLDKTSVVVQ